MAILPFILVITNHLLLLVLFFSKISFATDTITQLQTLSDGNTLVSKKGVFELGFFNLGDSTNRYVGIWYKNIPVRRIVWVANRDNPSKDNSSKLIISRDGNLVLVNQNQSLIWSTNITTKISISSPTVQLLDNGNLLLKIEKQNTEENFLWQSFDYPCDTILAGMKIGWDKKSSLARRLTAWKNWNDPSSGELTSIMVLTPNPEVFFLQGSIKHYRTGPWTGRRSSEIFGLRENPLYNYEFLSNDDEIYYMFTLKNSSVVSIIVMNETLSVRQRLVWIQESKTWNTYQTLPQDNCDIYNVCGANGLCARDSSSMCQCLEGFKPKSPQEWNATVWTQGCVHIGNWSCELKKNHGSKRVVGMKLPDTANSWIDEKMTLENCKAKCLKNCSCSAYSSLDASGVGNGCSIWFGDLIDLRVSSTGQDLYIRMEASNIGDKNEHTKLVVLVVSITVPAILVMAITYIYITKENYKKKTTKLGEKGKDRNQEFELPIFDRATIFKATKNFSFDNKLGEGGFGSVYKGRLLNGQEIAVKRLLMSSGQGLKEFKNEVTLCAKLQHRNFVKIVGFCIEGKEKMLIYEYMSNKSLDSFLYDPFQSKLLDCGYMAPKYAIDGLFSTKLDVFSFGVLLLEIISGKKNRAHSYQEHDQNLIGYAWRMWRDGTPLKLIDEYLKESCIESEALHCIQIGLLCLQHHPENRPSMASVIVMLSSESVLSCKPKDESRDD
ncbi:G-type lectin S-receptor serine/threonine-protein kinase [Trifolium repens]|nr:G-type lectin S-receptor serine/threonine-protein kinase [Trifolium repens]